MRSLVFTLLAVALLLPACSDDTTSKPDFKVKPTEFGIDEDGSSAGGDTIMAINKGTIKEGTKVVLKEVVVVAIDGYGQYTGDAYVQDPSGAAYGGLKLFGPQRTDGNLSDLKPGDRVKVEGTVKHFSPTSTPFKDGKKVIELDKGCTISKIGAGAPPAAKELSTAQATTEAEAVQWVHMLVKVKDVQVTKGFTEQYGEFDVGPLTIDDELFLQNPPPAMGDCVSLTGVLGYFYEYKLWPRTAEDFAAGAGCKPVATVTIKDLQDETSANHPASESPVKVTGVVTAVDTTPYGAKNALQGFWIEEPTGGVRSGIYVYYNWDDSTAAANKPILGNTVEVAGIYTEYKPDATKPETLSEIKDATVTDNGPAPVKPEPVQITNAADIATGGARTEDYEGVLVKVGSCKAVEDTKTTGATPKIIGFKCETSNLIVENQIFNFVGDPPVSQVGTTFTSITGVLHYSFGNFKILPRSAADLPK